jgi:hypothetical protein
METSDSPKPQRISAEERSRLVSLFRKSGLTQVEFARQNGIKIHTLHQWLYRSAAKRRPKITFCEVAVPSISVPGGWVAEVVLDSGMTLRVDADAKPELISFLIGKLRRGSC